MVKELNAGANHDAVRDGEDLAVHHELLVLSEFHEDDSEVVSSQVKGQELSLLFTIGKLLDICWEAFDRGIFLMLLLERHVEGVPHLLLHHVDVVIVQHQVPHKVFNKSAIHNNLNKFS